MKVLEVLYYYYYRLYSLSKIDDEPTFTTRLALTASESFLATGVLSILYAYFFCKKFSGIELIIIAVIFLGLNFYFLLTSKRVEKIIREKPKLFNSDIISFVFTVVFFVFTTSILFWLNDAIDYIIEHCGSSSIIP